MNNEIATLAGGCFWCLEGAFKRLAGVSRVVSGYIGGQLDQPSYEAVCSGRSGHAEAVQIHFDPTQISYRDLLEVFFALHDPTTLNRQGHDIGSQYRSAIFCHDPVQTDTARAVIAELDAIGSFNAPIVTEVNTAGVFWPAEEHHQNYYDNHTAQPYCQAVIAPKLAKLQKHFAARLKG